MPVTPDAINEAIQEGYTPDQIIQHIQTKYPEYQQRLKDAADQGYSSTEIVQHLRTKGFSGGVAQPAQQTDIGQQSDLPIPAQRAQMGLPTISPKTHKRIETISPGEARIPQAEKQIQEGQNAPTTPDPKGWKGFVPLVAQARSAEILGRKMGQGKASGWDYASYGGNVLSDLATAEIGPGAGMVSKVPGAVLGAPFKLGSKALGATVGKLPTVRAAIDSIGTRLSTWAAGDPLTHQILSRAADHEAETNVAYDEVDNLGKELGVSNLTDASKTKIYHAIEAMRGKGTSNALHALTDVEHELAQKLLPIRNQLSAIAKKEGVVDEAAETEGYLTRFYKEGKARGFLRNPMKTAPIAMKRTFGTIKELEEAQSKLTNEIESKGFTVDQILKKSDGELKDLGFSPQIRNTLQLRPNTDPIRSIQAQMLATRMAVATKHNIFSLADLSNQEGKKLIENTWSPDRVKLNSPIFTKWVAKSLKTGDTRLVRFAEKDAYVLRKYADNVQRVLNVHQDYPNWMREAKEINRVTKFLRFFNPAVHNINETSSALQYFNGNVFKSLGLAGKAISKDPNRMSEAIADGFQAQRLYDLKNGIAKDLDVVFNKFKSSVPYLTDTMDTIQRKFTNPALWNHVDHIGLTVWDAAKQKFIAQGMEPSVAGKAAVTLAHDVIGKMTSYTTMEMFKHPAINTFVNFIPSWINTSMRKYIGAFLPDVAFQHLPEAARKALQVEYQHNLIHGVTMGMLITQKLSYATSGHSTFENLPENRPSMSSPFGKIEMHLPQMMIHGYGISGGMYAVSLPVMGSLTLPPRLVAGMYNVLRGRPQAALAMLQPITAAPLAGAMEAYKTGSPGAALKAGAEQALPIRTFTDPKQTAFEATLNTVLPFKLQKADPRTDVVKKVWTAYKNDNKFEIIGQQEPWKNDLDKAIQAKNYDQAGQIIRMHYTGSKAHEFFQHRVLKFTKPNTYTYLMIPKDKRNQYLSRLSNDELIRFQDAIKKEATPEGSTP